MRVLVTNMGLGFGGEIIEDAEVLSPIFGGYVGHISNGVKVVIATDDGAIIVEDKE